MPNSLARFSRSYLNMKCLLELLPPPSISISCGKCASPYRPFPATRQDFRIAPHARRKECLSRASQLSRERRSDVRHRRKRLIPKPHGRLDRRCYWALFLRYACFSGTPCIRQCLRQASPATQGNRVERCGIVKHPALEGRQNAAQGDLKGAREPVARQKEPRSGRRTLALPGLDGWGASRPRVPVRSPWASFDRPSRAD